MTGSHRWSIGLVGLLWSALSLAQDTPTLTESKRCGWPEKSLEECKPEEIYTHKAFTEDKKDLYAEIYDSTGKLVAVNASSRTDLTANCSVEEANKMSCEFIDLLDQSGLSTNITKPQAQKVYHSDKDLAKALGLKESEIAALGLDWRFFQVVVWAVKTPKSKRFVVTGGEVAFFSTGKSGKLVLPFFESCPHGGVSGSEATPAPGVSVVVALLPTYFSLSGVKTTLEKADFDRSMCNKIPSAPPHP